MEMPVATRYYHAMSLRRPKFPGVLWCAAVGAAAFYGWACVSAAPASAGYVMSGPQSKELLPLLSQRPMDVYVATGAPDSCGPGCSKWIAVEGKIDPGRASGSANFWPPSLSDGICRSFFTRRAGYLRTVS